MHPRLITEAPGTRASLAMLPPLKELSDDFAWAAWFSVWCANPYAEREFTGSVEDQATAERFRAAAIASPECAPDLDVLSEFVSSRGNPCKASDALLRLADWFSERGFAEPAIQCAEAAGALVPQSARRALSAGRINRVFGELARAELFYERAIGLARHSRNWRVYVRGHLGKGLVQKALGDWDRAQAHYQSAARAAVNLSGEKWLAAQTQHDLFALAAEAGKLDEALLHAQRAMKWYPRHHSRFPALAHDLAFLLVQIGLFTDAVPLLSAVMRAPIPPADQVIGWSTLARAAAATRDEDGYAAAVENTLRLVGLFDLHAPAAFINLACAAQLVGRWSAAEQYGTRAVELAQARPERAIADIARTVLAAVNARADLGPAFTASEAFTARVLRTAADMAARLEAWRGPTWKRKRQSGPEHLGRV